MLSDIPADVGMNCDVYVSSELTFVLSVFGEELVQEVEMSTSMFQRWKLFSHCGSRIFLNQCGFCLSIL